VLTQTLTFRPIQLPWDSDCVVTYHRDACRASFGDSTFEPHLEDPARYLEGLEARIEEFPDGHLLAMLGTACVGQLELQVPYGLEVGYVNLFYVTPPFRGRGYGRLLQARAEQYFRSWEATRIELHVSPTNQGAVKFYRAVGYEVVRCEGRMLRMAKLLS
jgi:GNAT superfamily N-acetyltransferase